MRMHHLLCVLGKKFTDLRGDFPSMSFEGKVAGVVKIEVDVFEVLFIGVRTRLGKNRIVFAVNDQSWGLLLAEIGLKLRVKRNIILVVVEHRELNFVIFWAGQVTQINLPVVRAYMSFAGSGTVGVLPLEALG